MTDDADNLHSDELLDRAIRGAMRVDVDAERVEYFEQFWRERSRREKRRRLVRRVAACAAAAIVVVMAGLVAWRHDLQDRSLPAVPVAQDFAKSEPTQPRVVRPRQRNELTTLPGRAPTAYERLMFVAQSGTDTQPQSCATVIDELIEQTTASDDDAGALLTASGIPPANAEALLLRRLPQVMGDQQKAVLRLLAACGSKRSVPALLGLARNEEFRAEALNTLEKIVGLNGLARAVSSSTDANVRSALMQRLLSTDSQAGLLGFLSLVRSNGTRAEALAAVKQLKEKPINELAQLLDHSDESVRVAAAITLGYINGPETTRLLIARITERPGESREAWLALMECRGETAREFLDYATRRPQLLGYYNNARVHWAQVIQ